MSRSRLFPSLAALVLVSIACFVGCGGACDGDGDADACTACEDARASCVKACTTEACSDACNAKHNDCYVANCPMCG